MSRIITSGAELNSLTTNVEVGGTNGTVSIATDVVRSGSYAYKNSAMSSGVNNRIQLGIATALDVSFVRIYVYIITLPTAANTFIRFNDASNNTRNRVTIDQNGTIAMSTGGTGPALLTGRWYCLEFRFDRSGANGTHQFYCRVNGGNEFGSSALTITTTIGRIWIGGNLNATPETQTQGEWNFDDIAWNDNTGSTDNWYPGDGKIIRLKPNAAGDANTFATQTGGTVGAANNYTRLSEVTPDDATTFNGSSTLNEHDLVNLENASLPSNANIKLVEVHARHRNSTADTIAAITFELEKASGGTVQSSSAIIPNSTTWKTNNTNSISYPALIVANNDPDGSKWTPTTIDSAEVGYKLTTAPGTGGRRIDVSGIWLQVEYTIPPPVNALMFGGAA